MTKSNQAHLSQKLPSFEDEAKQFEAVGCERPVESGLRGEPNLQLQKDRYKIKSLATRPNEKNCKIQTEIKFFLFPHFRTMETIISLLSIYCNFKQFPLSTGQKTFKSEKCSSHLD